jgi:hypothetical protein
VSIGAIGAKMAVMLPTEPVLLDALADCLESGDALSEALDKVATAGPAAAGWAQQVHRPLRAGIPAARALLESGVLDDDERALLSTDGDVALAPALRAVAVRRQRSSARRRALRWSLAGPFAFAALTVLLDPVPELIAGGAYAWPVLRGLLVLVVVTLAVVAGAPALLRRPQSRPWALRICTRVPGVRRLAALYAEEELTTALAPFGDGGEITAPGLRAIASLLAWSPLGERLAVASPPVAPATQLPMGGLEALASLLSPATDLAIIGGVASKRLQERLARRGDAIALRLTARLRLVARIVAYTLVVLFSASSLLGMISRGLPGMPTLPGGAVSPDQKELEDLLKELEK